MQHSFVALIGMLKLGMVTHDRFNRPGIALGRRNVLRFDDFHSHSHQDLQILKGSYGPTLFKESVSLYADIPRR